MKHINTIFVIWHLFFLRFNPPAVVAWGKISLFVSLQFAVPSQKKSSMTWSSPAYAGFTARTCLDLTWIWPRDDIRYYETNDIRHYWILYDTIRDYWMMFDILGLCLMVTICICFHLRCKLRNPRKPGPIQPFFWEGSNLSNALPTTFTMSKPYMPKMPTAPEKCNPHGGPLVHRAIFIALRTQSRTSRWVSQKSSSSSCVCL